MYTQTEKVNIRPKPYLPVFRVSEGDVGRTLTAHLVSDEGDISIPIGATVTMAGTKPSGLGYTVTGTVDGSNVSFDTDAIMTDEPGRIVSEIRIVQGDTVIGTTNVVLNIEPNPHPNDTTDGQREPLINELTAILEDITEQIDRFTGLSAEAETLQPGSEATASYHDGVLTIGVPQGGVSLETLAKVMVSDTASGTIASFADGSDVLPAKSVLVTLEPKQSGSGTPSPSNIRPISGWDEVETHISPTTDASDGQTITTPLPTTVYGGTLDVVSGVLTVDRAMITIDGINYNMAMSGGSKRCYISDLSVPKAKPSPNTHTPAPNLIANYLTAVGDAEAYSGAVGVCIYATESANIGFTLTGEVMTFAEVKSYLASNPLQVCYELAKPQTYQLTPTEVNTLIGDNNVWGGDGVVVDYYADTKLYIEKMLGA